MSARCPHCGGVDESPINVAKCALRAEYRQDLARAACSLDTPPSPATVDALWAHLNTVYEDGASAYRAALSVLNLGWRPAPMVELAAARRALAAAWELLPTGEDLDEPGWVVSATMLRDAIRPAVWKVGV